MTNSQSPIPPKNVLMLTVDTWRADRMSVYGYERPTTPALENLQRARKFAPTLLQLALTLRWLVFRYLHLAGPCLMAVTTMGLGGMDGQIRFLNN